MKRTRDMSFRYVCMVVFLAAVVVSASDGAAGMVIAKDGAAHAVIVAGDHPKQAKVLQDYLTKINAVEVPVVLKLGPEHDASPAIVLAIADSIPRTSDRRTGKQAYRIHTEGNRLFLTGRSDMGLTHAVYGLLEDHLGARFFSQDYEVVPEIRELTISDIDDTQEPPFAYRGFIPHYEGAEFQVKNRGPGFPRVAASHNLYQWIPPVALHAQRRAPLQAG